MADIIPPFRFGIIEQDLYRSAQPTPRNYDFLRSLRLRTVVAFLPSIDPQFSRFASENNISVVHIPVERSFEVITLRHGDVASFLDKLEPVRLPMLVHCFDGAQTTGLAVACLRRQQQLAMAFIAAEFRRFIRDFTIQGEEMKFIDRFHYATNFSLNEASGTWLMRTTVPATPSVPTAPEHIAFAQPPARREDSLHSVLSSLALAGLDRVSMRASVSTPSAVAPP
eukprot:m.135195 g.135195  ORF g.135195 m.135195 type:complete len:225 (-) comp14864_c5_seq2:322-996(-)